MVSGHQVASDSKSHKLGLSQLLRLGEPQTPLVRKPAGVGRGGSEHILKCNGVCISISRSYFADFSTTSA